MEKMQVIATIENENDLAVVKLFMAALKKSVILVEREVSEEAIVNAGERVITANPRVAKIAADKWLKLGTA
jgi:hypothetical protein